MTPPSKNRPRGAASSHFARSMAADARRLQEQLSTALARGSNGDLLAARDSLVGQLDASLTDQEVADIFAEAIVCAAPILAAQPADAAKAVPWLCQHVPVWERWILDTCWHPGPLSPSPPHSLSLSPSSQHAAHLYEPFLHHYARDQRKRRGVFFTPQPIANYIVAETDRLIREEFKLPQGIADDSALLLDPAAGTGIFLLAAIERIHQSVIHEGDFGPADSTGPAQNKRRWNACVPSLLARLRAIELLPAAAFLARLNIAMKLADTGYTFDEPAAINIVCGDSLSPATQSQIPNPKSQIRSAFPVLIGNPPFSSLSASTNPWIARLVRGDDEVRGYIQANGERLNERKTWLHDDYVKFIRLAQWCIEQAGQGIVGFVTNHGYLDNATFRLMRRELLRVFPHIRIIDLHGNRKKQETAPDGARDQNVFGLDQGTAISILCRPPPAAGVSPAGQLPSTVECAELWGPREEKLRILASHSHHPTSLRAHAVAPQPPHYSFLKTDAGRHIEYENSWSLADAMPVNASAPVTARDHFVVAYTVDELRKRVEDFCNPSIPDDVIRARYFTRTRSARYALGDTRGWKLAQARRAVAADADWQRHLRRCLYRPFDWRYVFWHPALIDWPRTHVTRHLVDEVRSRFKVQSSKLPVTLNLEPGTWASVCLIARRQQLPGQSCTFFWLTDTLALDGVIRSDNRGSESLFPLYLRPEDGAEQTCIRANFAAPFVEQAAASAGLAWLPLGHGDLQRTFGPEDLLAYIYALFHAPTYRERYAESLHCGFPRLLLPQQPALFAEMSRLGQELIGLHLLQGVCSLPHSPLPPEIEMFRAGGYFALRKWLQPPHRTKTDPEYAQIAAAIGRTIKIMEAIDRAIALAGGFPGAFTSA